MALVSCGSSDSSGGPSGPAPPIIDVAADTNRNGTIDWEDPTEENGEETWTAASGATFVVNVDDDDADGIADNADEIVNGAQDELDLARIAIRPWPNAPETVTGTLEFALTVPRAVRLFRRDAAEWSLVDVGVPLVLSAADIRAGVELGIEGTDFVRSELQPWQGIVTATLSVVDGSALLGNDVVQLRAAPWLMNHNLRPYDTVYFSSFSPAFMGTMPGVVEEAGLTVATYAGDYTTGWADIWFEDWFQTGWTAMPGPNGGVHGMRVFNPRPWGRDNDPAHLPVAFLRSHMLGPDSGVAVLFDEATELGTGSTYDSHGNHEALPPYPEAPAGRLLLGSGIKQSTREFYAAQQVQPPIYLDTSWLIVGHMDEVYSAVRSATPRRFKMLQNTPVLAKELFEKWQNEGNGSAPIFQGKVDYEYKEWQTTVDQLLGDTTLMAWNQEAQAAIDLMHDKLASEAGLAEDEFVEVPVLYEEIDGGKIAYLPDTANVRVIGGGNTVIFAQTFGPMIGGDDASAKFIQARLTEPARLLGADGKGSKVRFADSWDYHVLLGDVHCASNWSALPTAEEPRWWEAAK